LNSEDMNDAELEAFLKGEDELARSLKGLPQPSPSSELDAAILKRAQEQMLSSRRSPAANDPATGAPSMRPLGWRWRAPAGIAATLMACVLAHQAWRESGDLDRAAAIPAAPATLPAQAELAPSPPPPPQPQPSAAAIPARPAAQLPPRAARVAAPEVPEVAAAAPTTEAPPVLNYSTSAQSAPAPAPAAVAGEISRAERASAVAVTGRRSRVDLAITTPAPEPNAWLAAIDELLKAGLRRDSLEEWDKFRAAYPDYPVPAETTEKINALRN
jgi:hypothetical protein